MITVLRQQEFGRILPLFGGTDGRQLFVDSMIAGYTRGVVYADDVQQPSAALVWDRLGELAVAGDPGARGFAGALPGFLQHTVMPELRRAGMPCFTLYGAPQGSAWADVIDTELQAFTPQKIGRRSYRFEGSRLDWRSMLPANCRMERIDEALLAQRELRHLPEMAGWVDSFWASREMFGQTGLGYCVVTDGAAASWCLSVFAGERALEFGVATAEPFRNLGFAKLVALACVERCASNGWMPIWQCNTDNPASMAVAERIGFVPAADYQAYSFSVR